MLTPRCTKLQGWYWAFKSFQIISEAKIKSCIWMDGDQWKSLVLIHLLWGNESQKPLNWACFMRRCLTFIWQVLNNSKWSKFFILFFTSTYFRPMLSVVNHGRKPKIQHMAPAYPSMASWCRHPSQNWPWRKTKTQSISTMANI